MPFDQVRFLTHQTRSEWLPSIFGSGSVMTAYDRWKSGVRAWNMSAPEAARKRFAVGAEFPGVFMSWHLGGERCLVAGDVVMVFPRDLLLEQRNFHLNVCDKNGFFIEGGTFFGGDAGVPDLAATRRGKGEEGDDGEMNEVVFHDSVPARLCVKMYCADPEKARRALPSWWKGRVLAMPDRFPSRPVGLPRGLRGLLSGVPDGHQLHGDRLPRGGEEAVVGRVRAAHRGAGGVPGGEVRAVAGEGDRGGAPEGRRVHEGVPGQGPGGSKNGYTGGT